MSNYKHNTLGTIFQAKQLDTENAINISVWLDYHQVRNVLYVNSPDLGVGDDERCKPGTWVIVEPGVGYATCNNEQFQANFTKVDDEQEEG